MKPALDVRPEPPAPGGPTEPSDPPSPAGPPPGWRGFWLQAFAPKRLAVALGLAFAAALAINPIFLPAFPVVLGRTVVVALLLLLAFTLAGRWPARWQSPWMTRWLPRWLVQVLAIVLAAPLATLAVYLPATGGSVLAVLRHEGMVWGVLAITGTALLIAPVFALGALYRERDAQARNEQLRFELERSTLERQALDSRLRLLHAQIEPHFLFNTLANVQALVESGSPRAAPVLRSLIAYLRAAMPSLDATEGTLGGEAALVRAYLELMQMRMPDRLAFDVQLPAALAAQRFPPMALLTLVENAVRHGIDPREQGGRIEVGARRDDDGTLRVWVADTGDGLTPSGGAHAGMGLANLRERLAAFHGPAARLELTEQQPHGLRATIVVPPEALR